MKLVLFRTVGYEPNGVAIPGARLKAFVGQKSTCIRRADQWIKENAESIGVIAPVRKWELPSKDELTS